ncbi:MAG: HDIG domain-containing protein [Deltaproteobacteria bacterium]|nr:HDIG domain-containing protein [Deltaproteobacteria bacterium]
MPVKMDIPPFVTKIIQGLQRAGHEAYIVGGAPRDAYLRRPIMDWDITTSASPEKIKTAFSGIRHFSLKHGTVTLVHNGQLYEVTCFRGSRGIGKNLKEDLGLRDFTINAMAYEPGSEKLLDPYGGRGDIAQGLVRAVGAPEDRFREDPLRLMRAIRIANQLGFRIDPKTLDALISMANLLKTVATERVRDEIMKVLLCRKSSIGFNLMRRTGLLNVFLPELMEGYLKRQNTYHRFTIFKHVMVTVDRVDADPVLRLTALFHDIAKPRCRTKSDGRWRFLGHEEASAGLAEEIMERLKFGKETRQEVTHLIFHHLIGYGSQWTDGAVRRLIRKVGPENVGRLLAFRRADLLAHGMGNEKLHLLDELEERIEKVSAEFLVKKRGDLAIDGSQVMAFLGLSPGPEVGKVLGELMEAVADQPERNTEEGLLELLKAMKKA